MYSRPLIFVGIGAIVLALGYAFSVRHAAPQPTTNTGMHRYVSDRYGLVFSYSNKYELKEMEAPGNALRFHHIITLQRKTDTPPPEGGEGPTMITIDLYQNNLDGQTTEGWIRGTSQSNFKLSDGTLTQIKIGGKDALSYRWSGLYEGTTIVRAEPNWIYAFTVTYMEPGEDIVQDFVALRDSVQISKSETPK